MDTSALRDFILAVPLQEQAVSIPGWDKDASGNPVNLIIRELDGKAGAELMDKVSDPKTKQVDQTKLVAAIILATLRNGDDPNKALVFSSDPASKPDEYNPAYFDSLMSRGLGRIMEVSTLSLQLSGLADNAVQQAKNDLSGTSVEGSLSPLPAN